MRKIRTAVDFKFTHRLADLQVGNKRTPFLKDYIGKYSDRGLESFLGVF